MRPDERQTSRAGGAFRSRPLQSVGFQRAMTSENILSMEGTTVALATDTGHLFLRTFEKSGVDVNLFPVNLFPPEYSY